MASFGRSFKHTSYWPQAATRRPPLGGRNMSNSSDKSSSSSSDPRGGDDTHSSRYGLAPTSHADPQHLSPRTHTMVRVASARSPSLRPTTSNDSPSSPRIGESASARSSTTPTRARPIAIELPSSAKTTTPPPLSARGDVPGGYFPLHEEQTRVYHPHPFQLDASKALQKSRQLANRNSSDAVVRTGADSGVCDEDSNSTTVVPAPTTAPAAMADKSNRLQVPQTGGQGSSRYTMPVSSYDPSGLDTNALPMGKYYPSNYERTQEDRARQERYRTHSSGSSFSPDGLKSPPSPRVTREMPASGSQRNDSDIKRRLQQYQRDMIAQATMAMNRGDSNPAALQSLRSMGFTAVSPNPDKPRLEPLGSPGPVTPMELGGSNDGYMGVHGNDDNVYAEAMDRMLREEEERRRREGASSPAIEL